MSTKRSLLIGIAAVVLIAVAQPAAAGALRLPPIVKSAEWVLPIGPQEAPSSAVEANAGPEAIPLPSWAALWPASPMSGPVPGAPVRNFGVVEEGILYRSSQPDEAGYRWLRNQGIKSIISFQRETGDNRDYVLSQGFTNYLWLNIEDETNPKDEQAQQFLDFVTNPDNWPILIHCRAGMGRTGTLAALVRYSIDGWPLPDALKEVRLYSGGRDLVDVQMVWLKRWTGAHPPASYRPLQSPSGPPAP